MNDIILEALREFVGYSDIRQYIIKMALGDIDVIIGETFSDGNLSKLKAYLKKILKIQGIILFTATNIPNKETYESHYQTYILDNNNKLLLSIDPAIRPSGNYGIYGPHISTDIIIPFFDKKGYITKWVLPTNTCQTNIRDVFCQTWSLILQIDTLKQYLNGIKVPRPQIPKLQAKRYTLLLNFYKGLMNDNYLCQEFSSEYGKYMCDYVKLMTVKDME